MVTKIELVNPCSCGYYNIISASEGYKALLEATIVNPCSCGYYYKNARPMVAPSSQSLFVWILYYFSIIPWELHKNSPLIVYIAHLLYNNGD